MSARICPRRQALEEGRNAAGGVLPLERSYTRRSPLSLGAHGWAASEGGSFGIGLYLVISACWQGTAGAVAPGIEPSRPILHIVPAETAGV
jgi:hypothetical protein